MGRRDNDGDKGKLFSSWNILPGKEVLYGLYLKIYVVTFCYLFPLPFAPFWSGFMGGSANFLQIFRLQQNRKET